MGDSPCSWIGLNIVKMSALPNTIPVKISASYFVDIDKPIPKFIWRDKIPRITNIIWKGKNKIGGLTPPEQD